MSLKLAESAFTSFELRPRDSGLLSISAVSDYLTVLLLNLEAFSHIGAFVSYGHQEGWILMLSLETISLWSVQQSSPHMAFMTLTSCPSPCLTMT